MLVSVSTLSAATGVGVSMPEVCLMRVPVTRTSSTLPSVGAAVCAITPPESASATAVAIADLVYTGRVRLARRPRTPSDTVLVILVFLVIAACFQANQRRDLRRARPQVVCPPCDRRIGDGGSREQRAEGLSLR